MFLLDDAVRQFVRMSVQLASIWPLVLLVEMLWPRDGRKFALRLKGVKFTAVYVVTTAFIFAGSDALLTALRVKPLFSFAVSDNLAPLAKFGVAAVLTLAAALVADFLYYWCHRAQHRFFWRFHAVHHAIRDLSAVNAYMHWTEELVRFPFITLPIALLLPVDASVGVPLITNLVVLHSYYLHAPTRLHCGPFRWIISDNRFHRVHHSTEPAHWDKNFGVLTPIWDIAFGTAYVPAPSDWPEVGLPDFDEVRTIADYVSRPFRSAEPARILAD